MYIRTHLIVHIAAASAGLNCSSSVFLSTVAPNALGILFFLRTSKFISALLIYAVEVFGRDLFGECKKRCRCRCLLIPLTTNMLLDVSPQYSVVNRIPGAVTRGYVLQLVVTVTYIYCFL